jgi:hypothetical protein
MRDAHLQEFGQAERRSSVSTQGATAPTDDGAPAGITRRGPVVRSGRSAAASHEAGSRPEQR